MGVFQDLGYMTHACPKIAADGNIITTVYEDKNQ